MRRTIELFLRGEFWLHLVTMFFLQAWIMLLAKVVTLELPTAAWLAVPLLFGFWKEFFDKYHDKKNLSVSDIFGTFVGGSLMIILMQYLL